MVYKGVVPTAVYSDEVAILVPVTNDGSLAQDGFTRCVVECLL